MATRKSARISGVLILLVICCLVAVGSVSGASKSIGGDRGWYVFHCHADGTQISLDNEVKGVITDGELSVPIYTTGTPYSTYTATYDAWGFHQTVTRSLTVTPSKGETVDIYVDITPAPEPVPTPVPKPVGGDKGWYDVYCNVDGASVSFDGQVKGVIAGNVLSVPVFTTGTPYSTVTVSAPDYISVTESVDRYPGQGETVDLYITLNRENDILMSSNPED